MPSDLDQQIDATRAFRDRAREQGRHQDAEMLDLHLSRLRQRQRDQQAATAALASSTTHPRRNGSEPGEADAWE